MEGQLSTGPTPSSFKEILNLEGHQNHSIGLKITAILLNGLILPIGGIALARVCVCSLRSRLVLIVQGFKYFSILR